MGAALGSPGLSLGNIAPPTARNQNVQQGVDNITKRRMRHPFAPFLRFREEIFK
jgi:hypothetical protein